MQSVVKKSLLVVMVLGILLSFNLKNDQVNAKDTTPPTLTTIENTLGLSSSTLAQGSETSKIQKVILNTLAIEQIAQNLESNNSLSQSARLQIFNDLSVDVNFDQIENTIHAGYIMSGTIGNYPNSSILLVSTDGIINANIDLQGKQYHLTITNAGSYQFEEIDQSIFPEEIELVPAGADTSADFSYTQSDTTSATSGYDIDVMVVYTPTARSKAGGTSQMQNLINLAVSETNTGYQRSGIFSSMRLVHTEEINYDEAILSSSSGWGTALSQLTQADNIIDNVQTLRNTYGADLVVMVVEDMTYCGIGWLMTPNYTYDSDSVGYSIVSRGCATGYYSFGHETGHNMGAHHDRDHAGGGTGMYDYSFGYQDPNFSFRTVMSYSCTSYCPRINNWSNPDVYYNGKPTGVTSTASNGADNRLTLNNTAPIVSNFRESNYAPKAPTNLVVQDVKSPDINLSFFDNSTDEQGFIVEKSMDNIIWNTFLTLPANTTSFIDSGLECGSEFSYRVYAFNQNGNSEYSNLTSTGVLTCTPPEPLSNIQVISSISSITLNWTLPASDTTYMINIVDEVAKATAYDQGFEITQLPFTLSGLEKATTYIITITAINQYGTYVNEPLTVQTMSNVLFLPFTVKN